MKEYKNSIRVLNLSGYQAPKVIEDKRKDWVRYVDSDTGESYFSSLIDKYLGSPTNSRCINGISDMIYGRGLDATDSQEKPE